MKASNIIIYGSALTLVIIDIFFSDDLSERANYAILAGLIVASIAIIIKEFFLKSR